MGRVIAVALSVLWAGALAGQQPCYGALACGLAGAAAGLAQAQAAQVQQKQSDALSRQLIIQALALRAEGTTLGIPSPGVHYAIDSARTEHRKDALLVWATISFESQRTLTTGTGQSFRAARVVEHDWITCKKHLMGWLTQVAYDSAGSATLSVSVPPDLFMPDEPVPASLDEAVLIAACVQEPPPLADSVVRERSPLTN